MTVLKGVRKNMRTYYYLRISTKEKKELQSFTSQENALKKYASENKLEYDEKVVYKEDMSGKSFDRPQWKKLEKTIKEEAEKGIEVQVIFKELSRFTREARNGYNKYLELYNLGITLVFLNNPTVSSDYIKKMEKEAEEQDFLKNMVSQSMLNIMLAVELDRVEKERERIVERIRGGIRARKEEKGLTQGRKTGQLDKMTDELKADIEKFISDRSIKQVDLMRKHNISRNTLKKYVKYVQSNK